MWSVVLVNQSGAIVDVLSGEAELRGAVAFAAGYGQPAVGAVVVMPSALIDADSVEDTLPTGTMGGRYSVFVKSDGVESKLNAEPYDAEQVAMVLESVDVGFDHLRIVHATAESDGLTC